MDPMKFREMALSAFGDLLAFADFTRRSEVILDDGGFDQELVQRYKKAWFEMEIVNSVALEEWESDGRPPEWNEKWSAKYRPDAEETIRELLKVLDLQ